MVNKKAQIQLKTTLETCLNELEGQELFENYLQRPLAHAYSTDGFTKGILFEGKLNLGASYGLNKAVKQARPYLIKMMEGGEYLPQYYCAYDINKMRAFIYSISLKTFGLNEISLTKIDEFDWFENIERLRAYTDKGATVKYHTTGYPEIIIGLAGRFYSQNPTANKVDFFDNYLTKDNDKFHPFTGTESDLSAIMDILNDPASQKVLGAFYTPDRYVKISTEYVRNAIQRIKDDGYEDYVILDRCVSEDTEYFNGTEWKYIKDYQPGEKVLQYNKDSTASLIHPIRYINQNYKGKFYTFTGANISMKIIPEHDMVLIQDWNNKLIKKTTQEVVDKFNKTKNNQTHYSVPVSFNYNGDLSINEDLLRIFVMINADGKKQSKIIDNSKPQTFKNSYSIRFSKKRKIERARKILSKSNVTWYEGIEDDYTKFTVHYPLNLNCKKYPDEWYQLDEKSKMVILDELFHWDGSLCPNKFGSIKKTWSSSKKKDFDFIQFLIHSTNHKAHVRLDSRPNKNVKDNYNLSLIKSAPVKLIGNRNDGKGITITESSSANNKAYCFTVPSGMLVLRYNLKIYITSNCAGSGNLLKMLTDEELSHCVVNTYEAKEWLALKQNFEGKVRELLPPTYSIEGTLVRGGNALEKEFYEQPVIKGIIENRDKCPIIMLENPPYKECGGKETSTNSQSYIQELMKPNFSNSRQITDLSNQFIWSAFELIKAKYVVIYAPLKYWKYQELLDKRFIAGHLSNRKFYNAAESTVSIIYWENKDAINNSILCTYDSNKSFEVKKIYKRISKLKGEKCDDYLCKLYHIVTEPSPLFSRLTDGLASKGADGYVTKENLLNQTPIFCANQFIYSNYHEIGTLCMSADSGTAYQQDSDFLNDCLIYTLLTNANKCSKTCEIYPYGFSIFKPQPKHNTLLKLWNSIHTESMKHSDDNQPVYGLDNVSKECDTYTKDLRDKIVYDHPELHSDIIDLKKELKEFYIEHIKPKMLQYELVK